jgi:putative flavoprotein involved in K+ transport
LQLGDGGASGSIIGNVTDNATFAIDHSDTVTFAGAISGTGAFEQLGSGTTIFAAADSYGGGTTISAGILQLGNGGTSGSIVGDVTIDDGATFAIDRSDTYTFAGTISGTGAFQQISGYHVPNVPRMSDRLDGSVTQLHSSAYRNPQALPPGEVLVIGSGQSGCQIAEDLHLAGRKVHLAVGSAPRCPRVYRGREAVEWLDDLGQYDLPVDQHRLKEKVRKNANHYLTGRDGGRDIDLRKFALEGMSLYGRLKDIQDGRLEFADDLAKNLHNADKVYNGICGLIDEHIARNAIEAPLQPHYQPLWQPGKPTATLDPAAAGISTIVWTTGFRSDWSWVELPIFDGAGYPTLVGKHLAARLSATKTVQSAHAA